MSDMKFIDELKKVRPTIAGWSLSLQKDVDLKSLSLAQQKTIIETAVDNTLSVLFFNTTFYRILEANCSVKMSEIDTIDRVNLALALRAHLQDKITIDEKDFSLKDVLASNKEITKDFKPRVIESTMFKFFVRKPSLEWDNRINNILLKKYKMENVDSNKLKVLIGDLFVYEILKFIEKIEFQGTGIPLIVSNNIDESVAAIEMVDSREFVEIVKFINDIRDAEKLLTKIPGTSSYIDLVPDFFVV